MSVRQGLATTVAPMVLRLTLGLTFLWAGLSKLNAYDPVQGADAAALANAGATLGRVNSDTPPPPPPTPESSTEKGIEGAKKDKAPGDPGPLVHTASEFVQPVPVRRLHTEITLALLHASEPRAAVEGKPALRPTWPVWASGSNAVIIAWAVMVIDLAGGVCVGLGLLTRLWAAGMVFHMAGALWLTTIGPAWAAGDAVLGFLPRHDPWDLAYWSFPFWQLALLALSTVLLCIGPGPMSLDRPLLGSPTKPSSRPAA